MKEKLLEYIESEVKNLKGIQYKRNQAQAFIVEGELKALEKLQKKIENF